jgi:hypothetical protein
MYCMVADAPKIFSIPAAIKMYASMIRPSSDPILRSESIASFTSCVSAKFD